MPKTDLTGQTFGRLAVLEKLPDGVYQCRCVCGNYKLVIGRYLKDKRRKNISCGCSKKEMKNAETHGLSSSKTEYYRLFYYKLTPVAYSSLLADQGGHCAVCPATTDLHVDHDHSCCTGKVTCGNCVRGILCGSCNRALGHAKEDAERLRRLADYAER